MDTPASMSKCFVVLGLLCLFCCLQPCRTQSSGLFGVMAANFAQIFQRRTSTTPVVTVTEPLTVYLTQYETQVKTETQRLTETETSTLSLSWLRWTTETEREFITETVTETSTSVDVSLLVSVAVVTLTERVTAYQTVTSTATSVSTLAKTLYSEFVVTEIASKCPTYTVSVGMLQRHGQVEESRRASGADVAALDDELHFSDEELMKMDELAASQLQKSILNNKHGHTFKVDEFVHLKPSALPAAAFLQDHVDIDDMDLVAMQRHLEFGDLASPSHAQQPAKMPNYGKMGQVMEKRTGLGSQDLEVVDIGDLDLVDGFLRRTAGQLTAGPTKLAGIPHLIKHSSHIESSFPSRQRQFQVAENSQADITANLKFTN